MKSKLIASVFAAIFTISLTVVALVRRFSKLPDEKNFTGETWWAPSPYEWRVLGKLDTTFAATVHRSDIPNLYSPIKIKSYVGNEPYFGALDEIRAWMIGDVSNNSTELRRALLAREPTSTPPAFKDALVTGFGGASDNCSVLKVERAFRLRDLDAGYFEPAMTYLESCKTEKGVALLARIARLLTPNLATSTQSVNAALPDAQSNLTALVAQLKQIQTEIDSKSLLAAVLQSDLKQIEQAK